MNDNYELTEGYQTQPNTGIETQTSVQAARAMQEVQGQIIMAKKFPRDEFKALEKIKRACKRPRLAEKAMYAYPRGGKTVFGPSIRLAEVIAQNYGNLDYGIREISQKDGESVVEAYCWDLETNVKQTKIFAVKHERKASGQIKKLTDPRDIYELIANNGARRMRACVLGVIPSDFVEDAVDECNRTMAGNNDIPFFDRVRKMTDAFGKINVTIEMIENKLNKQLKEMNIDDLSEMIKVFNSIKDGVTKVKDWFSNGRETSEGTEDLNAQLLKEAGEGKKPTEEQPKEVTGSVGEKKQPEAQGEVQEGEGKKEETKKGKVKADNKAPSFKI